MANKFETLTPRESVLKRPQMYLGSMDLTEKEMFIIKDDEASYETVSYIPAFRKIIDEILDNALDALITHRNSAGVVKIEFNEDNIIVSDDGPGIPVVKKELSAEELKSLPPAEAEELSKSYIPQIAWTRLFSGTNFEDDDEKKNIGAHGLGSKCTAIFSTKFIGKTDDGKNACTVTAVNNLEKSTCAVGKSSGKSGTTVKFFPDLAKFNLTCIEPIYADLTYQRILCLASSFPDIKFYFNKQQIKINDKKFAGIFSEHTIIKTFEHGFIAVFPNEHDDFKYFSYVNGLNLTRGGSHIDYVINQIVSPMRDKLERSCKNIKPADIKNKLSLVLFFRDFPNPKFDSQTKETLTNSTAEISSFMNGQVDFEKLAKEILKNEDIINPIVDMFKLKQELKTKAELKKASKKIKIDPDKYMPPIGKEKKYLALCEGRSAMSGSAISLGRDGIGYYAMRGVPLNAYSSSMQKIAANQELKDIINILGLDISSKEEKKTIDFDKILITSDADADGDRIASQLIGWFRRFAPNLFEEGKICRLITPVIITTDKEDNMVDYFYNVPDFKAWEAQHPGNKNKVVYQKGLGSSEAKNLIRIIERDGLESIIETYSLDSPGIDLIEDWLGDDPEPRKKYMKQMELDINLV